VGTHATFSWAAVANATSCQLFVNNGFTGWTGTAQASVDSGLLTAPAVNTYRLDCTGPGGNGTDSVIETIVGPPAITSPLTSQGTVGDFYSYPITATQSPTSFNAVGLPVGLSVDTLSGVISGTPTGTPGTFTVTISATNS